MDRSEGGGLQAELCPQLEGINGAKGRKDGKSGEKV